MMNTETAENTNHIMATHCAYCRRDLRDAASVEAGVGPVCRKKYRVGNDVPEDVRKEVNTLVWQCAVTEDAEVLSTNIARILALGCDTIAERLIKRCGTSRLYIRDGYIYVDTKFPGPGALQAIRDVPGRRWVADEKMNRFPATSADAVSAMLKEHFPGLMRVESTEAGFAQWYKAGTQLSTAGVPGLGVEQQEKEELSESATVDAKGRVWLRPNLDFDVRPHYLDEKQKVDAYDPNNGLDREVLAAQILKTLKDLGFERQRDGRVLPRSCGEQVWERTVQVRQDKPEVKVTVRVYTSIERTFDIVREVGDDSIKISATKHNWTKDRYSGGGWQLRAFGMSKDKRVHRTGTCLAIINRMVDRIERAYRMAAEEEGCGGCAAADEGFYCPLHMGAGGPRKKPSKKQVERDRAARAKAEERRQERYEARCEEAELRSRGELPNQWGNR